MVRIYTKEGDKGFTKLANGYEVPKGHNVIEMCGSLDELSSYLGVVLSSHYHPDTYTVLYTIQTDLFHFMQTIQEERAMDKFDERVAYLESQINHFDSYLEPLEGFLMPNGSKPAADCHYARAVCRRVERLATKLFLVKINAQLSMYLNRLGDLLFVLARYLNHDKERYFD